jgi:hypothetical protein
VIIRLSLTCAAVGALAAGAALAQDATYRDNTYASNHRVAGRCDQASARARRACENARYALGRDRRGYYGSAYGYAGEYYGPDYAYDDSDYYGPYGQPQDVRPAYYPPDAAEGYGAPAAYEGTPPPPDVAAVQVHGRRFWWEHPAPPSPGAGYAVRLHSYVNPHSSVTALPTPNNVADQVPSHGPDFDGVPPYVPY